MTIILFALTIVGTLWYSIMVVAALLLLTEEKSGAAITKGARLIIMALVWPVSVPCFLLYVLLKDLDL